MKAMGSAKPTRLRVWPFAASGVVIGLPLLVFSLHLSIKSAENRQWEEMRRWCEQAVQEHRTRGSRRPVLRGEALEGNAWDDYVAGIESLGSARGLNPAELYLYRRPNANPAQVRAIVQVYATSFDALRRGASRSHATRNPDWEGPSSSMSNKPYLLAVLAACKARFLVEEGHVRESMDLLGDAAQFGEDTAASGDELDVLNGLSIIGIIQDELKGLLAPGVLSREECRDLARLLELLDLRFPCESDYYQMEPIRTGLGYLQRGSLAALLTGLEIKRPIASTWRYGFSDRLVLADAFQTDLYWSQLMKRAAGTSWKEAREMQGRAASDVGGSRNPLLQQYAIIAEKLSSSPPRNLFRERRAQLRLLRGMAGYRAIGELPVLDDPYGDKIHTLITDSDIKLWSVGYDGVDDGGSGEWDVRRGKDIVLEVKR